MLKSLSFFLSCLMLFTFNYAPASEIVFVSASAGLVTPYGLAFNQAGILYVTNDSTISQVAPDGTVSAFLQGTLSMPRGLNFNTFNGGSNTLYVANRGDNTVLTVNQNGVITGSAIPIGTILNMPMEVAFDPFGFLYVSNSGDNNILQLNVVSTPSVLVRTFVGFANPTGLAFDNSGTNLYVANSGNNEIIKGTPIGFGPPFNYTFTPFVSMNLNLNQPTGLAFDSSGNLYVSNAGNNTISKVTPDGTVSTFISTGLNGPTGLAFDSSGNLYIANTLNNTIVKITPNLTVTAPSTAVAGTPFNFTVTALDDNGDLATGYTGVIHFTSTDPAAILPADSMLVNGMGAFSATLNTLGAQTITATDILTATTTATSNPIFVSSFPVISPATLPSGTVGVAYNQTITASGGLAPYTFSLSSGTLPPGLSLTQTAPNTAMISGTPTTIGTFSFSLLVIDSIGLMSTQAYTILISNTSILPLPPIDLRGHQKENVFATQTDFINIITWKAPPVTSSPIVAYQIFRDANLTHLITTISANSHLKFRDHNRKKGKTYTYYIVSEDQLGRLSAPASVSVKGHK